MKRKIRLLLAVVLAMAMVMGSTVTVLAKEFTDCSSGSPYKISEMKDGDTLEIEDLSSRMIYVKNDTGRTVYMYGECSDSPTCVLFTDKKATRDEFSVYITELGVNEDDGKCNWALSSSETLATVTIRMSDPDPDPDPTPTPTPDPDPTPAPDPDPTPMPSKEEKPVVKEVIDRDTYKSSVPSKTVMSIDANGKMDMDMKVHPSSQQSETNQKFLVNYNAGQFGKVPTIILTSDIFMRNDLLSARYCQKDKLVWNNLNYKIPGNVYAVVYNETDGAYLINGIIDANGNATFEGFILRPASTITIFAAN